MKMNKLAAGALALALGLGAVAPAVAAETKDATIGSYAYARAERKLAELKEFSKYVAGVEAEYNKLKKEVDETKGTSAADRLKKVTEEKDKLEKAVNDLKDELGHPAIPAEGEQQAVEATKLYKAYAEAVEKYETALAAEKNTANKTDEQKANDKKERVLAEAAMVEAKDLLESTETRLDEAKKAYDKYVDSDEYRNTLAEVANQKQKEAELARKIVKVAELKALLNDKIDAKKYEDLIEKYDLNPSQGLYKNVRILEGRAIAAGVDAGKIAEANGYIKNNPEPELKPNKPEEKKNDFAELEKAVKDAETTIRAVELLQKYSPAKIAKVKDKLEKLVVEQKALIEEANKLMKANKKTAFIATAYADEEKTDAEKAKELKEKLNKNTEEMNKMIADTPEDKEEAEKPAEKPEEKPADKKENKPAKESGKNAKTGIAGVAGVAGILAAASVAYAASKRD